MSQLPNYLRSNRKRLALSQDEVAFLLGTKSGAKVSRHEQFAITPNFITAMAYEVIYQKPIRELFGGLYESVEKVVRKRAKALLHKTNKTKSKPRLLRKQETIMRIAAGHVTQPLTPS